MTGLMTPRRETPGDRVERIAALDRVASVLRNQVNRRVREDSPARDALHGVWLGHPLHPALAQLPLGAWLSAALFDLLPGESRNADLLIATGLVTALPAASAGLVDYSRLHSEQMRVGVAHAGLNSLALTCYGASLVARMRGRRGLGRLLAAAGLAAASTSAYLGGHLAYRQAAGPNHAEDVRHLLDAEWHTIGQLDEFEEDVPTPRLVKDVPVVVVRHGMHVDVLAGRCSHQSGPLHAGEVVHNEQGACLRCPWHGSLFRLEDGAVVHGPATAPQPRFEVWTDNGTVRVRMPGAGPGE